MMRKNVKVFAKHGIYSRKEIDARLESLTEEYHKLLHIETMTMLDMVNTEIIPAVITYSKEIADTALAKKQLGISCSTEEKLLHKITAANDALNQTVEDMQRLLDEGDNCPTSREKAQFYHDAILPKMDDMRRAADQLEVLTAAKYWPFPTYGDLLFSV